MGSPTTPHGLTHRAPAQLPFASFTPVEALMLCWGHGRDGRGQSSTPGSLQRVGGVLGQAEAGRSQAVGAAGLRGSGLWPWVSLAAYPQVLLRVKESQLQYLKKEVQCLRDELQTMQKVGARRAPAVQGPRWPPGAQPGSSRSLSLSSGLFMAPTEASTLPPGRDGEM